MAVIVTTPSFRANAVAEQGLDALAPLGRGHPTFIASGEVGGKFDETVSVAELPLFSTRPRARGGFDINFAAGYDAVIDACVVARRMGYQS